MNWFEHIRSVTGKCNCNKKKLNASHMGTFICITFVIMILVLYQILTVTGWAKKCPFLVLTADNEKVQLYPHNAGTKVDKTQFLKKVLIF